MTVAGHIAAGEPVVRGRQAVVRDPLRIPRTPTPQAVPNSLRIRWTAALREAAASPAAERKRQVERLAAIVVAVEILDVESQACVVHAWKEHGGRCSTVFARQTLSGQVLRDDRYLHVDVQSRQGDPCGQRVLALTLSLNDGRVVFAQSSLLAEAGFPPGSFDPPSADWSCA